MLESAPAHIGQSAAALWEAVRGLLVPAAVFAALGLAVKGRSVLRDAARALPETRVTLVVMAVNVVVAVPLITLASTAIAAGFRDRGLLLVPAEALEPAARRRWPSSRRSFSAISPATGGTGSSIPGCSGRRTRCTTPTPR